MNGCDRWYAIKNFLLVLNFNQQPAQLKSKHDGMIVRDCKGRAEVLI